MLSSCYSHSLARRPLLPPAVPRQRVGASISVSAQPSRAFSLPLSRRVAFSSCSCAKNGWQISCFRNDNPSSESPLPDFAELLSEERLKPDLDKAVVNKKDWRSIFIEAKDGMFKAIGSPWSVPWTAETVLQVTLLWVASFWFIGTWLVPFAVHLTGFSRDTLSFRGQALYSLLTDVTEGISGILILRLCLARFHPLPPNWFTFNFKPKQQYLDVTLGCLMFPIINRLSQFNLDLLPLLPSTPVVMSNVEQSIVARDPVAMALYAVVVTVCAPLWEEVVFRGFLLPSLTRYMPVWCAIVVSSVAFALAHFSVQRMLPLMFLGMVMGVLFTRSRNLVPSMLLHSLWNAFVFMTLM